MTNIKFYIDEPWEVSVARNGVPVELTDCWLAIGSNGTAFLCGRSVTPERVDDTTATMFAMAPRHFGNTLVDVLKCDNGTPVYCYAVLPDGVGHGDKPLTVDVGHIKFGVHWNGAQVIECRERVKGATVGWRPRIDRVEYKDSVPVTPRCGSSA